MIKKVMDLNKIFGINVYICIMFDFCVLNWIRYFNKCLFLRINIFYFIYLLIINFDIKY